MKTLSLLLVVLVFFSSNLLATIHETEYSFSSISPPVYIDVDNDGDHDFYFDEPTTDNYHVYCSKSTSYYAAEGSSGTVPKAYSLGSGMGTYHWQNGNGVLASSSGGGYFTNEIKYLMVKFNSGSNTYYGWFTIGSNGGYSLTIFGYAYSDVVNETIKAGEYEVTADFDFYNDGDGQISFANNAQSDDLTHSWDFGDGGTSTDKSPYHTYTTNGTWHVCVTSTSTAFGRSDTYCEDIEVTDIQVGIKPLDNSFIRLIPNPAETSTQIETGNWRLTKVELIDVNGKVQMRYLPPANDKVNLDVRSLPQGFYVCRLTGTDGRILSQVIVKN